MKRRAKVPAVKRDVRADRFEGWAFGTGGGVLVACCSNDPAALKHAERYLKSALALSGNATGKPFRVVVVRESATRKAAR